MELASRVRVRVTCGAESDGGELAAISDLGDGREGERLDDQRPAALELRATRFERVLRVLTLLRDARVVLAGDADLSRVEQRLQQG